MKKIIIMLATIAGTLMLATSCIEELDPQGSTVTGEQAGNAPGAFNNFVSTITSTLAGQFGYSPSETDAYDFGYPTFFLMRDMMGQDMAPTITSGTEWYMTWYSYSSGLRPSSGYTQMPWTYYYGWIKNCNTVLTLAGETPSEEQKSGAGIAYAMRAMFYLDLARMYANKTYAADKTAETVPYVSEKTTIPELANNPRLTNEAMFGNILADLDKAEEYLAGYQRADKYTPDLSVVYGLKARAYLTMEDWANAEKYAKLAMDGYAVLTQEEYTDRKNGFNTPNNNSWMFALRYKPDDPNITQNDADSSWGSQMIMEVAGFGYASTYGAQKIIDRHLYETVPATDCRKKCYLDFDIDNIEEEDELIAALSKYSDYPESLMVAANASEAKTFGGFSLKFRANGGAEGHTNQYIGFCVSVPLMRVEEMKLIEAEAVGMQNEAAGIALLEAFGKQRDANYTYGRHNEAYGNSATSAFRNEIWWQRRIEFWGEGMAAFDIKRLQKSVIRSYAGTNHPEGFRWNSAGVPEAMNYCIVQSETNYNSACTNNPTPTQPSSDSPEYAW